MLGKTIPINDKWIVDSGATNHMTDDEEKLFHKTKYNGSQMVITANNTRLPIKWIGDTVIVPRRNQHKVEL